MKNREEFTKELTKLLNMYSIDAQTNTPDFVLAEQIVILLNDVIHVTERLPVPFDALPEHIKVKPDGWSL